MGHLPTTIRATALALLLLGTATGQALAFRSGDVPAPVDGSEMNGPGKSHTNRSGISGYDGNQGNGGHVGNAGGQPTGEEPDDGDGGNDGGEDGGDDGGDDDGYLS
jgi:hypothetical protein